LKELASNISCFFDTCREEVPGVLVPNDSIQWPSQRICKPKAC